ncbi:MAG: phosphatidate cytidylyltransferase [Pseudomonadota bacterium]|nr:phosphatidate cytidylyltransferase [Pseudomonadota bacterium]
MLKIRILTAAALTLALLIGLFVLPATAGASLFAAVFVVAAWEWSGLGSIRGRAARLAYTAALSGLLIAAWRWSADPEHLSTLLTSACAWWIAAALWVALAPGRHRPMTTLVCGVPVLIPAFIALMRMLVAVGGLARGSEMVLWMLLLVIAADVGAYFVGRRFGRRKLAPRVSPGKTWAGAIGGLAGVAMVASLGALRFGWPAAHLLAFGCAVGVFSVVGDLTESMFKRAAGLKDSGSLLPGHGGILDRIDSMTAAAPLYALGLIEAGALR